MSYNIPILFIIFRRPEIAAKSFEQIRKVRPERLYIACDGARNNVAGEDKLVEETKKKILGMIDWACEVNTLFQDRNLGCSNGVYTAINWLFENEDIGIILEDDCMAQNSFFQFMDEMLIKYKDDERVGMVDGANYINNKMETSYCFSKYKSTNGWATWKRSWKNMDLNMKWRNTIYEDDIIRNSGYKQKDIKYWKYRLKLVDQNYVSAWDWQWYFTLASQNQLSIFPHVNLVSNIGFGEGATHTGGKSDSRYIATQDIEFPLKYPEYVMPYNEFDKAFYKANNSLYYTLMRFVPTRLKIIIKKMMK